MCSTSYYKERVNFENILYYYYYIVADVTADGPQRGGEATPTQGLDATYPNIINSKNIKNSEILVSILHTILVATLVVIIVSNSR
jgi:hypothetical protein